MPRHIDVRPNHVTCAAGRTSGQRCLRDRFPEDRIRPDGGAIPSWRVCGGEDVDRRRIRPGRVHAEVGRSSVYRVVSKRGAVDLG